MTRPDAATDHLSGPAARLAARLIELGFTEPGLHDALDGEAVAALHRGEPAAVAWTLERTATDLEVPVRAFLLREPVPEAQLAEVLGADLVAALVAAGVFEAAPIDDAPRADAGGSGAVATGRALRALVDVRPVHLNGADRVVFSDRDASVTDAEQRLDHVPGMGQASLTLLRSVPDSPVGSLLDLGCGCGVQSLAQAGLAEKITATDVLDRALEFTRATLAGAGRADAEVVNGPWFEPVAGRRFDRIVSNPPFVVGPPEVGHVYRDSGLGLDAASATVVSGVPGHLNPGGHAHLLAAWVHRAGENWAARVASWLPEEGVAAWALERDRVDPSTYVGTWLRDEGVDPRSPEGAARTRAWLDYFAAEQVEAVGFGFVAVENIGEAPSEVVAEELTQAFTDPLGPEVEEYFRRAAWLRERDAEGVLAANFRVRPGVALEEVGLPDAGAGMGFADEVKRLTRTDGPRFSHEVDAHVAAVVAGLHPQGLTLSDVAELYAAAKGLDAGEVRAGAAAVAADLVRHGLLLPADQAD
ncbi:methyltransferase [Corynebacterium frankenforstense]|uniref:DUF7782 domain-containing protein n=1 Tax=Corynebacterium frankenforstense TaxID=1230998 RepID=UPI00254F81ED|nr:methyltransferase [Corynebacterium frankenforstense]MDK6260329.1 methyltransferase [Corynebacterium frankenforstense]